MYLLVPKLFEKGAKYKLLLPHALLYMVSQIIMYSLQILCHFEHPIQTHFHKPILVYNSMTRTR